jgi:phosphate transport system protein
MSRERYVAELKQTRLDLLVMGAHADAALKYALESVINSDRSAAEHTRSLEVEIDSCNKNIYQRCLSLLTLQAPVAGDARLLTRILEAIVGLELIGDYADDIAELALRMNAKPASATLHDLAEAGKKVQDTLAHALDSWRHLDRSLGLSLRSKQSALKNDCEHLIEKLTTLSSASRDSSAYVALILICKDLERITVHSVNIAEQAAFTMPSYS